MACARSTRALLRVAWPSSRVILAHEIDIHNNSKKIWLESDFMLVIQALKNSSIVPWSIRYRWENNLLFCKLNLIVSLSSNVYKERNFYAHALANHKASSKARFTRWQSVLLLRKYSSVIEMFSLTIGCCSFSK
ncbi:hypothetical protein JHK87_050469 [Glycine soja]|nr:hypothetical protein JHK87_050469 [Glycine soja]